MEKGSCSGNEGLLFLASLVSIQLYHQVTNDQLAMLAAFFNILAADMTMLIVGSPTTSSSEDSLI